MNRLAKSPCLLAVLALLLPAAALAQGATGVRFGLSGGADFPVGDQRSAYDTGWNGTLLFAFNFPEVPLGLRLDGSYHQLPVKGLSAFSSADDTRVIDGTLDLVIGAHDVPVSPYALGGVGVYDIRFRGVELSTGNAFSDSTTKFGWNVGAGVAFQLGPSDARLFVEARYTDVSTSGDRFTDSVTSGGSRFRFVPVNVGIVF